MVIRSILSNLRRISQLDFTLRKYYHSHFDPNLSRLIEVNPLKPVIIPNEQIKLEELKFNGVEMELRFYDSHCNKPGIKYNASIIPTILVLPSGEFSIENYDYLIGNFVKDDYRVIALEFPGKYFIILIIFKLKKLVPL